MSDIYQAPNSDLTKAGEIKYGSVATAISGDYDIAIGEIIKEAWKLTYGSKWTVQLAYALYFAV